MPRTTVSGPYRYIVSSRRLTPEELQAIGRDKPWSLVQLTCGHSVMRMLRGGSQQRRSRCGFCKEERDQ